MRLLLLAVVVAFPAPAASYGQSSLVERYREEVIAAAQAAEALMEKENLSDDDKALVREYVNKGRSKNLLRKANPETRRIINSDEVKEWVKCEIRYVTQKRNAQRGKRTSQRSKPPPTKRNYGDKPAAAEADDADDAPASSSVEDTVEEPAPDDESFELKGDKLGMSLKAFKKKYARKVKGDSREAPLFL